jgi:transcriptional regulator with XRE-family HTH domain
MSSHPTELLNTQLLRDARIRAGITERGLARQLGTSPLRIRRLEAGIGHDTTTIGMLIALATTLNLEPALLLQVDREPPRRRPSSAPLSLREAKLVHLALSTQLRVTARGSSWAALAQLLDSGALIATRDDPEQRTHISLSATVIDALDLHQS